MLSDPLISVVVLTYNSEDFILETLESIYAQRYPALELIVADDFSKDGTIAMVTKWLSAKKDRFIRTKLILTEQNTGTSANCNRGLEAASGIWLKYIAGDDLLDVDFFSSMKLLLEDPTKQVIAGEVFEFKKDISDSRFQWPNFDFPQKYQDQKRLQLVKGLLLAPSVVVRKSVLEKVGGFDLDYKILEDDPMWFKLTLAGYLFYFSPHSKVYYRQHPESVNSIESRQVYYRKPILLNDLINFGAKVRLPCLLKEKLFVHAFIFYLGLSCEKVIFKNGSKLDSFVNRTFKKVTILLNKIYLSLPL